MEFVPLALACGHLLEGFAQFEAGGGEPPVVECPRGCGMQPFVADPFDMPPGEEEVETLD